MKLKEAKRVRTSSRNERTVVLTMVEVRGDKRKRVEKRVEVKYL